MSERFVTVHRTYDPIQADLLGDLLRDAGIAARVLGTRSGAAIGVGQNILEAHIAVPEDQAGPATDFLEAYFTGDGRDLEAELLAAAGAPEEDEDEEEEGEPAAEAALRPLIAAGAAFVTFGVGHLYARRPWTSATLAIGQGAAIYYLLHAGASWREWAIGFIMLGAVVASDLAGAMVAVRAHNRGVRRGATWQTVVGGWMVAGSMILAHAIGPILADPTRGPDADPGGQLDPQGDGELLDHPLERDPHFPPLTGQHPANPQTR
jgi:hypothetical protein